MASSTDVRRSLHLVEKKRRYEVYISPSKRRILQREVAKVRGAVLPEFSFGERIDRTEGSLTRMCEKIFIKKLVEDTISRMVSISSCTTLSVSAISSIKGLSKPFFRRLSSC